MGIFLSFRRWPYRRRGSFAECHQLEEAHGGCNGSSTLTGPLKNLGKYRADVGTEIR